MSLPLIPMYEIDGKVVSINTRTDPLVLEIKADIAMEPLRVAPDPGL
jgi:hypothetical protein